MANKKNSVKKIDTRNSSDMRQKTHERVDQIMDKAEDLRNSGQEKMVQLQEKALMMKDNVDEYIKRNPEKSVLIAAGVGVVVGAMIAAAIVRKR